MSFLAPLFLLGGLAVTLPIVFHLIRRSSREQVSFSSLMFLRPTPPRMTKRSRIEHILLLLLRCLVIALLALGFARPFFQNPILANAPLENGGKIILLVDTSASMKRTGLWEAALVKADAVLQKISPADQVAVFTFDSRSHSLISFEQWSAMNTGERATLASGQLAGSKPGWAFTHLGNALTAAAEAFADADKQGQNIGRRRIVLITDLQEGSRLDGLQGYDWPRGVEVQIETARPKRPTNAGLQWVVDNDDSAKAAANTAVRVRVGNSANAQHEQFQLHWEGAAGTKPLDIYIPPGQSRIVPAPPLLANVTGEHLMLTGDDDDFDNSVYVIQPKPETVKVLYLGADVETNSAQPLFYLKRAFQQTRRQDIELKQQANAAVLSPNALEGVHLLIASDALPAGQLNAAQNFINTGGTALFVLQSSAGANTLGQLLHTEGVKAEEVVATNFAMLGLIEFQHPLFAPFADARFNDFTKIHFWKYRRLDTTQLPHARVLARFDSGDPAMLEIPFGKGRVLVFTSGWQPTDSQLALSSKFVPLLYSILDLAGGFQTPAVQFHIGDPVNIATITGPDLRVTKPDGAQVSITAGETVFAQTDLPGIYTVSSQPPFRFVVNLDASESRTAPMSIDELERLGVPLKIRDVDLAKQQAQEHRLHDTELENRQKLWRWLTLMALVVLLGETLLAGWLSRRTGARTEVAK